MSVHQLLIEDLILLDFEGETKPQVIEYLIDRLVEKKKLPHREQILHVIMEREELGSTGIGNGVALPHGRIDSIDDVFIVFGRTQNPIEFDALDGRPVTLIFLIVSPTQHNESYLRALSTISRLLKQERFRNTLLSAIRPGQIVEAFREEAAACLS